MVNLQGVALETRLDDWFSAKAVLSQRWSHFWLSNVKGVPVAHGVSSYKLPTMNRTAPHSKEFFVPNCQWF